MNNQKITVKQEDVKAHFAGHWQDFYSHFLPLQNGNGNELKAVCPFHEDSDPSFTVNSDTGLFHCFGCNASGDAFQFYGKLKGISSFDGQVKGIARDFHILSSTSSKGRSESVKRAVTAAYHYTDEKKKILFRVKRIEPGYNGKKKTFVQSRLDEEKGWIEGPGCMNGVRWVLYYLHLIVKCSIVFVVEGEKDADRMRKEFKLCATTCAGGAGKWRSEYNECLRGKDVILIPDNDEPGRDHVEGIARSLNGIAKSIRVLDLPGLPPKGDVSDWIDAGGTKDALQKMVEETPIWEPPSQEEQESDATELFPRGPFPGEVLPGRVWESFNQLARSCASSVTSIPGAAIAIFASVIGSVVSVCPKSSWFEPLIFWIADIRPSGEGKTPSARALCNVLYKAQTEADKAYKEAMREFCSLPKKERDKTDIPPRARSYFFASATTEGLREDKQGHGGMVGIMDEVSQQISSLNEYKGGQGSDREVYLSLFDGHPGRNIRVGKSTTISGVRISFFGGCQNAVFRKIFSGGNESNKGIYLVDGTVFRFCFTYGGTSFHPLTAEAWADENREHWEGPLSRAMEWANRKWDMQESHNLILSAEAQEIFFDWRNEMMQIKLDLPEQVRGFIPKLVGYALRFAGVLYLMDCFDRWESPGKVLGVPDIRKGMKVSEFYLGHIIEAMKSLVSENAELPFETTDQTIHLVRTLDALRGDVDKDLLAVGFIQDAFNRDCAEGLHVSSPKAMGAILRRCGLTIEKKKHWKDQHGVSCLKWDEKTERLLETSPQSPQSPQSEENQDVMYEDIEKSKSSQVLMNDDEPESMRTLRTLKNQSPHIQATEIIENEDIEDIEDMVSKEKENSELDWSF